MAIKDGGPAFPRTPSLSTNGQDGMSLRDYLAAHAMVALVNAESFQLGDSALHINASRCWRIADAMLAERERQP